MARLTLTQLYWLLREGLDQRMAELKKLGLDKEPRMFGSDYPLPPTYQQRIMGKVVAKEGDLDKSRRKLRRRLQRFLYPYPEGNKKGMTFYGHVKDLGLLDLLLQPPVLYDVRMGWAFRESYEMEHHLLATKKSHEGYDLEFHRHLMYELARHITQLDELARKYRVPRRRWEGYRKYVLMELFHEGLIYYPKFLWQLTPVTQIHPHSVSVDAQEYVFDALQQAFGERKITNRKLAFQLTSLICSSPACIRTRKLDPNPEAVRRNIRDRQKAQKNSKGEETASDPRYK